MTFFFFRVKCQAKDTENNSLRFFANFSTLRTHLQNSSIAPF